MIQDSLSVDETSFSRKRKFRIEDKSFDTTSTYTYLVTDTAISRQMTPGTVQFVSLNLEVLRSD